MHFAPEKPERYTIKINFFMKPSEYAALVELAEESGVSISVAGREAISFALQHRQPNGKLSGNGSATPVAVQRPTKRTASLRRITRRAA